MDTPGMPEVLGRWEGYSVGAWCEGGSCTTTLMESICIVYTDGSWVRTCHDPNDPLRSVTESSDDVGKERQSAAAMIELYRGFAHMPAPVRTKDTATAVRP